MRTSNRTIAQNLRVFFLAMAIVISAGLLLLAMPLATVHAAGTTIIVNSTAGDTGGPNCKLRDAIAAANTSALIGGCNGSSGEPFTIVLANSATYTLTVIDNGSITNTNGLPIITSNIIISGTGATIKRDNTAPIFRIFQVNSGGSLTLNNVTVSGGRTPDGSSGGNGGDGAGIYNFGTLIVTNSTFFDNSTGAGGDGVLWGPRSGDGGNGGAIYNTGIFTVTNSTFSNNSTGIGGGFYYSNGNGGNGGAIYSSGILIMTHSTFSGNSTGTGGTDRGGCYVTGGHGGNGGGIYNAGTLTVTNTSLSANAAGGGGEGNSASGGHACDGGKGGSGGHGGGFYNAGIMNVTNTTFSGNGTGTGGEGGFGVGLYNAGGNGGNGGGIYNGATLTMTNVTLSGNSVGSGGSGQGGAGSAGVGGGIRNDVGTATLKNTIVANSTLGGNCSGTLTNGGSNLDSAATCGFGTANGSLSNSDPLLGPLANNGGTTQTMVLLPGSPAIDRVRAIDYCPATDQRGVSRPQGRACDIGAYEGIYFYLYLPLVLKNSP